GPCPRRLDLPPRTAEHIQLPARIEPHAPCAEFRARQTEAAPAASSCARRERDGVFADPLARDGTFRIDLRQGCGTGSSLQRAGFPNPRGSGFQIEILLKS